MGEINAYVPPSLRSGYVSEKKGYKRMYIFLGIIIVLIITFFIIRLILVNNYIEYNSSNADKVLRGQSEKLARSLLDKDISVDNAEQYYGLIKESNNQNLRIFDELKTSGESWSKYNGEVIKSNSTSGLIMILARSFMVSISYTGVVALEDNPLELKRQGKSEKTNVNKLIATTAAPIVEMSPSVLIGSAFMELANNAQKQNISMQASLEKIESFSKTYYLASEEQINSVKTAELCVKEIKNSNAGSAIPEIFNKILFGVTVGKVCTYVEEYHKMHALKYRQIALESTNPINVLHIKAYLNILVKCQGEIYRSEELNNLSHPLEKKPNCVKDELESFKTEFANAWGINLARK